MDPLWGEFLPVREERLHIMQDQEIIQIGDLSVKAVDVPGHANHHFAYFAGDICFSGDVGGIRVHGLKYLSVPMPPPDIHIEKWRESIKRMQAENPTRIAPTHFGIYDDAKWHLAELKRGLDLIESWMKNIMSLNLPIEALRERFVEFERQRAENAGLSSSDVEAQQIANPSYMSADGIQRYWQKYIAQNP